MPEKLLLKGDIHNLSDGRYFAALGAEWISICFNPENQAFIHPKTALEIKNWLYGPKFIATFDNNQTAEIESIIETLQPDAVQLLGDYQTNWVQSLNTVIFREIVIGESLDVEQVKSEIVKFRDEAVYYILNFNTNNIHFEDLSQNFIPQIIESLIDKPFFLDGLFTALNVKHLIEAIQPAGICLKGSSEIKTGTKSFEELDAIVETLGLEL